MKLPLCLCALLLVSPAFAKGAPKPKPCPKGTVATTEKATGKQVCFEMILPPMQPAMPMNAAPAPKKN